MYNDCSIISFHPSSHLVHLIIFGILRLATDIGQGEHTGLPRHPRLNQQTIEEAFPAVFIVDVYNSCQQPPLKLPLTQIQQDASADTPSR